MGLRALYRDAVRKYRREGAASTARGVVVFLRRYVSAGFQPSSYQSHRRVDLDQRWEMMHPHVSEDDENVLDIGCAEGELTKRFGDLGLFGLGIDVSDIRLDQARKKETLDNNVRFIRHEITPENVGTLPPFDVTLLLAVYQHWGTQYGVEAAEDMLRELAAKTDTLFFEPPEKKLDRQPFDSNGDRSVLEYWLQYLDFVFDGDVGIQHLGTAEYKGRDRQDPVFRLDCADYAPE